MASWGDTSAALNENGTLTVPGGYKVGPDFFVNCSDTYNAPYFAREAATLPPSSTDYRLGDGVVSET